MNFCVAFEIRRSYWLIWSSLSVRVPFTTPVYLAAHYHLNTTDHSDHRKILSHIFKNSFLFGCPQYWVLKEWKTDSLLPKHTAEGFTGCWCSQYRFWDHYKGHMWIHINVVLGFIFFLNKWTSQSESSYWFSFSFTDYMVSLNYTCFVLFPEEKVYRKDLH